MALVACRRSNTLRRLELPGKTVAGRDSGETLKKGAEGAIQHKLLNLSGKRTEALNQTKVFLFFGCDFSFSLRLVARVKSNDLALF